MTIDDARIVKSLIDSYDEFNLLPSKVRRMFNEGKNDEITNLLLELIERVKIDIEAKIKNFDKK